MTAPMKDGSSRQPRAVSLIRGALLASLLTASASCTERVEAPPLVREKAPQAVAATSPHPATPPKATGKTTPLAYSDEGTGACSRFVDGKEIYERCPESLLPEAPSDWAVSKASTGDCYRAGKSFGLHVKCPPGGPTAMLPEPSSMRLPDGSFVSVNHSLTCRLVPPPPKCPPNITCDVFGRESPCPRELLPLLAPGVRPTKRVGARCWYFQTEVSCTTTRPEVGGKTGAPLKSKRPVHKSDGKVNF